MGAFSIQDDHFLLDGQPFRIFSGAMHYFRIPPEYWEDRLLKLRLLGLNTLETYVAWNLHEPRPGQFNFTGGLDLAGYLRLAARIGFKVLLRPGPYICAEWELGGLPAWLLKDPGMRLRCSHPAFLAAVERYFAALLPHILPLQASRGGPVIAVQVENEYGSYGNDQAYLQRLAEGLRGGGIDAPLFTADGPGDDMLAAGGLPDVFKTVNFAARPLQAFEKLRQHQPAGPLLVTEFWDGWFDHWGEDHHTTALDTLQAGETTGDNLETILQSGASFNLYMAHGGTNFGFMNGANGWPNPYRATVTSYDYDAPLNESGDLTPKFFALREIIVRHTPLPELELPAPLPKQAYGSVKLEECAPLFTNLAALSQPVLRPAPEPMEYLDQDYGFILYRTRLKGPFPPQDLHLHGLADRAQIFLDGKPAGVLEREFPDETLSLELPVGETQLDILVENMGRINFGPGMLDRKGLSGPVVLGRQCLFGWEIFPLPLTDLSRLVFAAAGACFGPAFYRGRFQVDAPADTFVSLPGWSKGVVWINGFNLGRYWERGPQHTLYLPAPLLHPGENELVVFELHYTLLPHVELLDHPRISHAEL